MVHSCQINQYFKSGDDTAAGLYAEFYQTRWRSPQRCPARRRHYQDSRSRSVPHQIILNRRELPKRLHERFDFGGVDPALCCSARPSNTAATLRRRLSLRAPGMPPTSAPVQWRVLQPTRPPARFVGAGTTQMQHTSSAGAVAQHNQFASIPAARRNYDIHPQTSPRFN